MLNDKLWSYGDYIWFLLQETGNYNRQKRCQNFIISKVDLSSIVSIKGRKERKSSKSLILVYHSKINNLIICRLFHFYFQ